MGKRRGNFGKGIRKKSSKYGGADSTTNPEQQAKGYNGGFD